MIGRNGFVMCYLNIKGDAEDRMNCGRTFIIVYYLNSSGNTLNTADLRP